MKKLIIFILIFGFLFSSANLFADETFDGDNWNDSPNGLTKNIEKSDEKPEEVKNSPKEEIDAVSGEAEVIVEKSESEKEEEPEEESEVQKRKDTLSFGLESEITDLISTLLKEEDKSLNSEILEVFNSTKNVNIREKAIEYFTKIEDNCLKDYALMILEDPYDEKTSSVNLLFKYVTALKITEAAPLIQELLDSENEEYYDAAITALGAVGGPEEALFLADFLDRDLTTARKQNLMKALGQIQAVETWDKLVEVIQNEDENTYVRMYAAEAIGAMEKEESIDILLDLFEDDDPNIRTYAIKGLSYFDNEDVENLAIQGLKDNYYKVRLESIELVKKYKYVSAVPSLLYRAKNDSEATVKYACFEALAFLDTKEGNEYLISLVKDTKKSDTLRSKAAASMLKYEDAESVKAVIEVTLSVVEDTKKTALRYALGKEIAKYENSQFRDVCEAFLASKDVSTQGIGLDIWKKNRYITLKDSVTAIAEAEKASANRSKARLILEIE